MVLFSSYNLENRTEETFQRQPFTGDSVHAIPIGAQDGWLNGISLYPVQFCEKGAHLSHLLNAGLTTVFAQVNSITDDAVLFPPQG